MLEGNCGIVFFSYSSLRWCDHVHVLNEYWLRFLCFLIRSCKCTWIKLLRWCYLQLRFVNFAACLILNWSNSQVVVVGRLPARPLIPPPPPPATPIHQLHPSDSSRAYLCAVKALATSWATVHHNSLHSYGRANNLRPADPTRCFGSHLTDTSNMQEPVQLEHNALFWGLQLLKSLAKGKQILQEESASRIWLRDTMVRMRYHCKHVVFQLDLPIRPPQQKIERDGRALRPLYKHSDQLTYVGEWRRTWFMLNLNYIKKRPTGRECDRAWSMATSRVDVVFMNAQRITNLIIWKK